MSERDVSQFEPTARFSRRVADYVRFRPRYPRVVLDTLAADTGLTPASVIADIGSGTGFSAEMFLQNGNTVYGVEPNAHMRHAGETYLAAWPAFHSVAGTAEATTLRAHSIDYVVAGQALHWFDLPRARAEFARIVRPGGWLALIWNTRDEESSPFMRAYETFVRDHSVDSTMIFHTNVTEVEIATLFERGAYTYRTFANSFALDFETLLGRTASSSYMPERDDARYAAMESALRALFARHARAGRIEYLYKTELYFGRPAQVED